MQRSGARITRRDVLAALTCPTPRSARRQIPANHGALQSSHSTSIRRSSADGPPAGGIELPWPAVSRICNDQRRISDRSSKWTSAGPAAHVRRWVGGSCRPLGSVVDRPQIAPHAGQGHGPRPPRVAARRQRAGEPRRALVEHGVVGIDPLAVDPGVQLGELGAVVDRPACARAAPAGGRWRWSTEARRCCRPRRARSRPAGASA